MVWREQFVSRSGLAGVSHQGSVEVQASPPTGDIQAIPFRLVQRVDQRHQSLRGGYRSRHQEKQDWNHSDHAAHSMTPCPVAERTRTPSSATLAATTRTLAGRRRVYRASGLGLCALTPRGHRFRTRGVKCRSVNPENAVPDLLNSPDSQPTGDRRSLLFLPTTSGIGSGAVRS